MTVRPSSTSSATACESSGAHPTARRGRRMAEVERAGKAGGLFGQVSALIEQTRAAVATQANAALALVNWQIGHLIDIRSSRNSVLSMPRRLS